MIYTTIASNGINGPIVGGLTDDTVGKLFWYFGIFDWTDFSNLLQSLVNADMSQVEANQPEGQRIELDITGLDGKAAWVAGQIQNYYQQGKIKAPDGSAITPWPEYPGTIAWGDSSTDTLTLRWVKENPFVWILVGVLLVALGYLVYKVLTQSSWTMSTASTSSGTSTPGTGTTPNILGWILKNWWWELPLAGALAIAPWVIKQSRRTYEEEHRFSREIEGGY